MSKRLFRDTFVWITHPQLRARRVLSLFKDIPLRTRRALSMYNVYSDRSLLVLNGISLNSDSALLTLNWLSTWYLNSVMAGEHRNWKDYTLTHTQSNTHTHTHTHTHTLTHSLTHLLTHTHTRMRWFSGNRIFGSETGDMNYTPLSRCVFIRCPQKHCNK